MSVIQKLQDIYCVLSANEPLITSRVIVGTETQNMFEYSVGEMFQDSVEDFSIKVISGTVNVTLPSGDSFQMTQGTPSEQKVFGNGSERDVGLNGLIILGEVGSVWHLEVDV